MDSGAAISVYPKSRCPSAKRDKTPGLTAVNKSVIKTYGSKTIKLRFDRKIYHHNMLIADISTPILGWDFIKTHQMDIMWSGGQCVMYSAKSKSQYELTMGKTEVPNLAPINSENLTFSQYVQKQKNPAKQTVIP